MTLQLLGFFLFFVFKRESFEGIQNIILKRQHAPQNTCSSSLQVSTMDQFGLVFIVRWNLSA